VGALAYVRRHHGIKGDGAGHYLADAIPRRIATLIAFNDDAPEDFAMIRLIPLRRFAAVPSSHLGWIGISLATDSPLKLALKIKPIDILPRPGGV
jgi:hypothetical protein